MIQLEAYKDIDIHTIHCIAQVKIKTQRPDIVYFLKNMQTLTRYFSSGEVKNIYDYLEYLGLLRNGNITHQGEKAIDTKQVMIPEAGIYEMTYIKDKAFGNKILNLKRVNPTFNLEGNIDDFKDYEIFDEKYYKLTNSKDKSILEFWLKFEKQKDSYPKVLTFSNVSSKLNLFYKIDENGTISNKMNLSFKLNESDYLFEGQIKNLDIDFIISSYLPNWNSETKKLEVKYEDIKDDNSIKNTFQVVKSISCDSLIINQEIDDSHWEMTLCLPIVPESITDAENWMVDLTKQNLYKKPRYLSKIKLKELHDRILRDTPILQKFPAYYQTEDSLLQYLNNNNDKSQYQMVLAVEDLFPN
ncbi:MAG: hypothetical protein GYA61_04580 [Spirochaetales bacterium]|jgi:hypothetical protein|nr:hypothetical protein [Exilispira sp.]NMC67487.1 hypothetical protein [Spirochaetales bacterium]